MDPTTSTSTSTTRITIRLADPTSDQALVDALRRRSIEELASPEQRDALMPRAQDAPTACFLLAFDTTGVCVGMAGSVLPGPQARYGFERRASFPHPALPITDRSQLGEGLMLYVAPAERRGGLARALTFLSTLLLWDAGASHIAAENGAVSLGMARAAGFTDTGVVTIHNRSEPYHLVVGSTSEVLRNAWPASERALTAYELEPTLQTMLGRFLASPLARP